MPAVTVNSKLALFYDWLLYQSDKDNIMNIGEHRKCIDSGQGRREGALGYEGGRGGCIGRLFSTEEA